MGYNDFVNKLNSLGNGPVPIYLNKPEKTDGNSSIWDNNMVINHSPTLPFPFPYHPDRPLNPEEEEEKPIPESFYDIEFYYNKGHTAQETYDYLKTGINNIKEDPQQLQTFVDDILQNLHDDYDSKKPYKKIADTNPEILEAFIKNDCVDGAICTTIHGFMMDTLHECDIPAVITFGKSKTSGHATLLYQVEKGSYICNNYGKRTEIKADNIVSAIKKAHKQDSGYSSKGYVIIKGYKNEFYQEFQFKDEAAFGKEIDKSSSDIKSAFSRTKINSSNSFSNINEFDKTSSTNNFQATIVDSSKENQLKLELELKNSKETDSFNKSQSFGMKALYTNENNFKNGNLVTESGITFTTINGKVNYNITDTNLNYNIIRGDLSSSYKHNLYTGNNTNISGIIKGSQMYSFNCDFTKKHASDARTSLEGGLSIENNLKNITFNNEISAGKIMDSSYTDYNTQSWGVSFGNKYNVKTAITYSPRNTIKTSATMDGFYTTTQNTEHYGLTAGAKISYKPDSKTEFYGGTSVSFDKKHLEIGLFDENINNEKILTGYGGVKINNNLDIFGSYSQDLEKRNKSASIGINYNY